MIGETLTQRTVRGAFFICSIIVPYIFVHFFNHVNSELTDAERTAVLATSALLSVFVIGFTINLLIVSPYELWREQKKRADAYNTASPGHQLTSRFEDAMLELRHVVVAREAWFAYNSRRDERILDRLTNSLDRVRQCFPPEAPNDLKSDAISMLYDASLLYGEHLGFGYSSHATINPLHDDFENKICIVNSAFTKFINSNHV